VAGNLDVGTRFLEQIRPILMLPRGRDDIIHSIEKMRTAAIRQTSRTGGMDIKSGVGGLRDVEFLVQGLQLIHAPGRPQLLNGNTLGALEAIRAEGILSDAVAGQLREDYLFLRKIEHYLQILEDRQIHALPKDLLELEALAKRILGIEGNASRFLQEVEECCSRVRQAYVTHLLESE
jgi:glutamate-ammonia-ligase adenylyltransferase